MKMHRKDFDTIVIGAGIVGSGCAYKIAKSGRKTLLLDQFPLGHVFGSSHGASRIIRCTHSDPVFLPFVLDAYKEWDELQWRDGHQAILYIKNGLLTMDVDWPQTQLRAKVLRQFGVPHEVLRGGQEIQRKFPHLVNYDERWSAIYEPNGGTLLAENCLKAVQRQFMAQGSELATLKVSEKVMEIVPKMEEGSVEVITNKGKYLAENVVVAVGGWLPHLLPDLPLKSRAHIVGVNFWRIKSRPELYRPVPNGSPNLVISDEQGQELFGLPCIDYPDSIKFAIHFGMPVDRLAEKLEQKMPEWMEMIPGRHLAKHFPDLDSSAPAIKSTCVYTNTDDLSFIVDRHPRHPNIFIAGGFSGTGFKFALTIGNIMAKWAAAGQNQKMVGQPDQQQFDLSAFRLDRKIDVQQRARL